MWHAELFQPCILQDSVHGSGLDFFRRVSWNAETFSGELAIPFIMFLAVSDEFTLFAFFKQFDQLRSFYAASPFMRNNNTQ